MAVRGAVHVRLGERCVEATGSSGIAECGPVRIRVKSGCGLWGDVGFGLRAKEAFVECVCGPHIGLALNTAGHVGVGRRGDAGNSEVRGRNSDSELETLIQGSLAFLEETPWPRDTMAGNSADLGTMWRKNLWACEPLAPSRAGHGEVEARNSADHKWSRAPSSAGRSWFRLSSFAGRGGFLVFPRAGLCGFWLTPLRAMYPFGDEGCGPVSVRSKESAGRRGVYSSGLRAVNRCGCVVCGPEFFWAL